MINLKDFDPSLLKMDKKFIQKYWYLQHWIHCNKKTNDYKNIDCVNPLYLIFHGVIWHIEYSSTEEKSEGKNLVLSPDNALMDKYNEVWRGIKNEIGAINGDKKFKYNKDFMKA